MGALMRAKNWAATPFGAVESWPQSLRTAVSMMLESRFAMVVAWGPEFRFLYNDRYRPVLGSSKHPSALGRPAEEIFPEAWSFIGPLFDKTRTGEAVALDDVLIPLHRNGYLEDCYFTISYSPIRDESGGVGGMLAVVAETTERVQSERRLATLRDLLRAAGESKTSTDACGNAAAIFGKNPQDVPFALLYLTEPDGTAVHLAAAVGTGIGSEVAPRRIALEGAESDGGWPLGRAQRSWRLELVEDAQHRFTSLPQGPYPEPPASAVIVPLVRPNAEQPFGYLVAGVSARRTLDDAYQTFYELAADHVASAVANARAFEHERRRAEELAELDRAKTNFFSNISHELRTPLTLMLGPLDEAMTAPDKTLGGEGLELTRRNARRLLKLVNGLLDFSRIEAGRMKATYEPVDLAALTGELASTFRSAIERAGLRLRVDAQQLPEQVFVDRDMWEKIVLNLLSNAFKFTFEGEIAVTLRPIAGGRVELAVSDTGIGIPLRELPRIFDRFHRVEGARSRTQEGSGIGLALVQELVRLHGGDLRVESRHGGGTTFRVTLPTGTAHLPAEHVVEQRTEAAISAAAEAFSDEVERWLPDAISAGAPADLRRDAARILVADDNADLRTYLRRVLGTHWRVEVVSDGVEAFEAARTRRPDLIVTDVMMPRLDGFGLLAKLREDERTRGIPVMVLSARAGEEARIEGLEAGVDDYLVKPFSARELVARVGALLAQLENKRDREELLARELEARREAESQRAHFYALLEQAPNPMVVLRGPNHVIELANPPTCEVWGRTREQVVGKPLLEALPELDGQVFRPLLDSVLKTGVAHTGRETPMQLKEPGGSPRTVFFNFVYSPLRDVHGSIDGILVVAFDVTEEVRARKEVEQLRAAAEAANRTKDEFLAVLGHELRNPLAPMSLALQLMNRRGAPSKEQQVMQRQVNHLTRLVDDLLDVSRITQGKIELRCERAELSDVLRQAVEVASPLLEHKNQHLELDVPMFGFPIVVDRQRMTQVFSNLLTNAAKYSDAGRHITVRAAHVDGRVRISFADEGIGIPADMLPRVFEPFVQQQQALDRARGGLGLGLAIVRSLVELHGGSVTAHSEGAGQGTQFVIELPEAPVLMRALTPGMTRVAAAAAASARRILVVDDNRDAAESLRDLLVELGHEVHVVYDGPSALEAVLQFRPNIALVDIGLPVMDGYEVGQRIRTTPSMPRDLRLVAVTGYAQPGDRQRSHAAGFQNHLVKPVDVDVLTRVLEEV